MSDSKVGFLDVVKALKHKPMQVLFLMGFASGTPMLLTLRTLQAWMTDAQVDLATIGFFAWAGLPHTLKFLWSPVFDRYSLPLGRRRGWLLLIQIALAIGIASMALTDPQNHTLALAGIVVIVSFLGACQDIVADAYRREILSDKELGLGSSVFISGYFTAMWVTGGFALGLAQFISWPQVYLSMAAVMVVGIASTLWAEEPQITERTPTNFKEATIDPLMEFFRRGGAIWVLCFVLFFKMGDAIAGAMLTPYYLKMGYSKLEIAAIAKTLSLPFKILGGFMGGALILRWGLMPCLWLFGILQALSTFGFITLSLIEHNQALLGTVILFEDVTAAMGTSAFVAFIGSMTNRKFTATQYALLSALSGVPLRIFSGFAGLMVESIGWIPFFTVCTCLALPGLALIPVLRKTSTQ